MTTGRNEAVIENAAQKPPIGAGTPPSATEREYWNRRYAAKKLVWTANANRFVIAEVANLLPGRALDLAAGEGRNAVWLAERGWSVRAVDFSAVAIEKGGQLAVERKIADKIDFEVADLRGYEPVRGGFDLVTLIYLQIPEAELAPIIVQAARAVAPGGTFLLVAHDSSNLEQGYGGPQDPDLLYTAEQVLAALGGQLDIEKAGTVERPVETDSGIKVAIDCLVRGKRHD
ncbi:MAG: SAM-dependent methyltransferase [Pseudomonadota bacterium]